MKSSIVKTHQVILAAMLASVVATQIFYVTVVSGAENADLMRMVVWTWEAVAFSLATVSALVLTVRSPVATAAFAALALGGVMNVIQVGMGLAEFGPAREAADKAVFSTVLAGAFFLYFHGKAMFGFAAALLGLSAFRNLSGIAKIVGGFAALTGIVSIVVNIHAMATGMEHVQLAGAVGTAATALLAVLLLIASCAANRLTR